MSTFNSDSACVLFWYANTVFFRAHFLFTYRVVNGVVYFTGFGLINWLAYRVLDRSCFCFVDGFADGVVDGFGARFVNGLLYRVIDGSLVRFVYRFADRVFDGFLASLVYGASNGVVNCSLVFLVDWFADCVIDGSRTGLVFRYHDGVVYISSRCLGDKATALHLAILVVNFISLTISSLFYSIVNRFSHCFHASVRSASHGGSRHFIAISGSAASTTALVADCATIRSTRGICTGHDRTDHDGGYDPQPIHLDFSTGNNTSVARRSFGDHGASAHMSRHRSSCSFRHK